MLSDYSLSSSECTPEHEWPEMTEEEALEIWERRGRQIEEERTRRGITDPSISMHSVPAPPPTPAEEAEWQRLTTHNPYSPDDLANRDQYLFHQRFINSHGPNRPRGGYIASTPQFAQFLDQYGPSSRHVDTREVHHTHPHHQVQVRHSHPTPRSDSVNQNTNDSWRSAQVREYERLAREHQQNQGHQASAGNREYMLGTGSGAVSGQSDCNNEGKDKKKTSGNEHSPSYYMGRPGPSELCTKSVLCHCCNTNLFVPPLANSFYCQTCCSVTTLEKKDKESQFEEKMQDISDMVDSMDFSPY